MQLMNVETWNPKLAHRWIETYIEDATDAANDLSNDVERLKRTTDLDVSHPEIFRAFIRGACGFDPALDCSMIFFLAMCIGDESVYSDLANKHRALEYCYGVNDSRFPRLQNVWKDAQDAFMSRPDVVTICELL
jgi:hypothetical protein